MGGEERGVQVRVMFHRVVRDAYNEERLESIHIPDLHLDFFAMLSRAVLLEEVAS